MGWGEFREFKEVSEFSEFSELDFLNFPNFPNLPNPPNLLNFPNLLNPLPLPFIKQTETAPLERSLFFCSKLREITPPDGKCAQHRLRAA